MAGQDVIDRTCYQLALAGILKITLAVRNFFVYDTMNFGSFALKSMCAHKNALPQVTDSRLTGGRCSNRTTALNCRNADARHGGRGSDLQAEVVHERFSVSTTKRLTRQASSNIFQAPPSFVKDKMTFIARFFQPIHAVSSLLAWLSSSAGRRRWLDCTFPKPQDSKVQSLSQHRGQMVLVVNTESFFGFSGQQGRLMFVDDKYSIRRDGARVESYRCLTVPDSRTLVAHIERWLAEKP